MERFEDHRMPRTLNTALVQGLRPQLPAPAHRMSRGAPSMQVRATLGPPQPPGGGEGRKTFCLSIRTAAPNANIYRVKRTLLVSWPVDVSRNPLTSG
jgi:hypothetical protein